MSAKQSTDKRPWQEWRAAIWDSLAERFGYPGLAALEQYMRRSAAERRCADCGEPGTARQVSVLIPCVPCYWFCADCAAYWRGAAAGGLEVM